MATTPATWTIDPVHSSVEFSLDYMGFSTYRTGFRALEGTLQFDAAQPLLAWCLAARGQHDAARALVTDRVKEAARADHDTAFWVGILQARLGALDEAMEWLRRSVFLGNDDYILFRDGADLAPLRAHPPFQELLTAMKLRWERRGATAAS